MKSLFLDQSEDALEESTNQVRQSESASCSVMSDSMTRGLWPARQLCPWNSPGKNTGVGSHSLSRGSSRSRDGTQVSYIAGRFFTI